MRRTPASNTTRSAARLLQLAEHWELHGRPLSKETAGVMKLLLLLAVPALTLASCNTTAGFGQDLQKVGSKLEKKADETGGTE